MNPFGDASRAVVLLGDFPNPAGCKLGYPVRLEQIDVALVLLDTNILSQLATEVRRKQDVTMT